MLSLIYTALIALLAMAGGEENKGGLLNVEPGLIIWTVIIFVILLFVMKKFAWKPILTALDEREKSIKDSLEKAEIAQQEAQRLIEENKKNIAKADEEAQKVITQSREYAAKLKEQMLQESKEQAKLILDDATAEIDRKKHEAFDELKTKVAELAINAAEKIIRESLNTEQHKKIVKQYIDELPKN